MPDLEHSDESVAPPQTVQVAVWLQLVLVPLSFLLAFLFPVELSVPSRFKLAWIAWVLFTSGSTVVARISARVRMAFRFVLGPPQFRSQWVVAQIGAWVGTMAFVAICGWFSYAYRQRNPADAIGAAAISAIPAAIGSYILALGFMPLPFFEDDWIGRTVYKFLGCKSLDRAPWACRLGFAGLFAVSVLLLYVNDRVFRQ